MTDQDLQPTKPNPYDDPRSQTSLKPAVNYWMVSALILVVLLIASLGQNRARQPASEAVLVLHLVDAVSQQPVSGATATLSEKRFCIDKTLMRPPMIRDDCPKGAQWQVTSNESGDVLFTDPTLITKLQKEEAFTSLALEISVPQYSNIRKDVIFSQTQPPEGVYYPDDPNVFYTFLGKEFTVQLVGENDLINSDPVDLFKYIARVENSKLEQGQLEAWKVEINTNLLTNNNINTFRINLFDGSAYEVERNKEQMQGSVCDAQECTWVGYMSGRSCMVKDTATGKCSPGETIIFALTSDTIAGTIPAVAGVNQYAYSIGRMASDPGPFLIKIDPSKLSPD